MDVLIQYKMIYLIFSFERISKISGKFEISYDENGNLVSRHNFTFQYDVFGRIQKVFNNGKCEATMFYQSLEETPTKLQKAILLMIIRHGESEQEIIQYFYGNRDQPFQITAVYSTLRGWTKLYYDDKSRLFSMLQRNPTISNGTTLYYIITDISGTPTHILNSTGKFSVKYLWLFFYSVIS